MEINLKNKKALTKINKIFSGRSDAIKSADGYSSMVLEAKSKSVEEEPEPNPS